jgi:4-amino-4-deoxy-L-arabinose transferase-like glycosyltransferase
MHLWDRRSASKQRTPQLQPALATVVAAEGEKTATGTVFPPGTGSVFHSPPRESSPSVLTASSLAKLAVGILIVAAVVGPWVWLVQQRAPEFLRTTVTHDVIDRAFEPLEQHTGPPGYYLLTIWGTFFPWCLFLPMAMIFGWRHRGNPRIRFAWAAVVGPWIFFELLRTKLPHYGLPCFPALAFLTADALVRCFRREEDDLVRPSFLISAAIWSVAVLALGFIPWLAAKDLSPIPLGPTIAWSLVAIAYAVTVFALFTAEKPRHATGAMAGGMVAAIVVAFGFYLPNAWFFRLSGNVADALKRNGATLPGQEQMIAYKEPSLAFYQGGTIREQPENDFLITHPPGDWPEWLTIRSDVWERMPASVKDQLTVLQTCRGWAYTDRGRMEEVVVVRKK